MARADQSMQQQLRGTVARAERGDVRALYDLGLYYATRLDSGPDYVSAHKWFNLAALRGYSDAVRERRELAREMSRADVALAQRAAREWQQSH